MSEQRERLRALKTKLEGNLGTLEYRVKLTNENIEKRQALMEKKRDCETTFEYIKSVDVFLRNNYNKVSAYIDKKKKDSINAINVALYAATTIINPTDPVQLFIKDKKAKFLTKDKRSVTNREGGGFRGVLGFFTRPAIVKNTNYIPFIIFDEAVARLSSNNTAILSSKLPLIDNDCQLVIIEQKAEMFRDIPDAWIYAVERNGKESDIKLVKGGKH